MIGDMNKICCLKQLPFLTSETYYGPGIWSQLDISGSEYIM